MVTDHHFEGSVRCYSVTRQESPKSLPSARAAETSTAGRRPTRHGKALRLFAQPVNRWKKLWLVRITHQRHQAASRHRGGADSVHQVGPRPATRGWYLTQIYVHAGPYDDAMRLVREQLAVPGYLSIAWMRADPLFAPLESRRDFAELTQSSF